LFDALQKYLPSIQSYSGRTWQLLQQWLQAMQRMRTIFELEWIKMPLLWQSFEDTPTQQPAEVETETHLAG
jgi:hypothetical protein